MGHYALLEYRNSFNLGDEVQSLAAAQFLPRIDATIDRDTGAVSPGEAAASPGEAAASPGEGGAPPRVYRTLYNGWFDGQYAAFPPPAHVAPIFLAFHVNDTDHSADPSYARLARRPDAAPLASHAEYLRRHGPVGCRDLHTVGVLTRAGVPCFFSGCLTLTLRSRYGAADRAGGEVLAVDVDRPALAALYAAVPAAVRAAAVPVAQAIRRRLGHAEKMALARAHLDRIARARLVITSRLHTALPALAFGVPLVFLNENMADVRFSGYERFLTALPPALELGGAPVDLAAWRHPLEGELRALAAALRGEAGRRVGEYPLEWPLAPVADGVAVVSVCMDRNAHLAEALPSWVAAGPDEIVVVDWGSREPVAEIVRANNASGIIRLVTVGGVDSWELTKPFNLAARMSRRARLLKADADTVLAPDFFARHALAPGAFYAGDWRRARDVNERHTNGILYVARADFFAVGGLQEFFTTYGYDDTDLQRRLAAAGLEQRPLELDSVRHIPHGGEARTARQRVLVPGRLDVEIEANRLLAEERLWVPPVAFARFRVFKHGDGDFAAEYCGGMAVAPALWRRCAARARANRGCAEAKSESGGGASPRAATAGASCGAVCDSLAGLALGGGADGAPPRRFYIQGRNGLGNRLRAFCSARAIADATGRETTLIWPPDEHCGALFGELFRAAGPAAGLRVLDREPAAVRTAAEFTLVAEAGSPLAAAELGRAGDYYDYVRAKDKYIDDAAPRDIYVSSACVLKNKHTSWQKESALLRALVPTDEVVARVATFAAAHAIDAAVGVHIRMGQTGPAAPYDDVSRYAEPVKQAINTWRARSHWEIFAREMRRILDANPAQRFFVCCDRADIFGELAAQFGDKVFTLPRDDYDRSAAQVKTALVDALLLGRTKYLLGSNWSTFTELAHRLNGRALRLAGVDFT